MTTATLAVFCADIGSVEAGNFGWYGGVPGEERGEHDPATLAEAVATHLTLHHPVALGFECPLFVPLAEHSADLTAARDGEGTRPWSATAGATALATGLTQVAWILRRIRRAAHGPAFLKWEDFLHARSGLFLWEAFASGEARGQQQPVVARLAVAAFRAALPDPRQHNAISVREAYSLAGAALLRTGWKTNPTVLSTPALVIRVAPAV